MESTFIRGFVLLMALTGFGASSVSSHSAKMNGKSGAHAADLPVPTPLCLPNSGNYCGMQ